MVMEISRIRSNTRVFLTCVEITFVFLTCVEITFIGYYGPFCIEM